MNKKSYFFDMETFRNMLLICPKLSGQKFVDPPFEEEILTFIRELGYPGNIKLLSNVKVDTLPQPWRTFGTIINKCLSGKVTEIDTLCLSRAHILWGLYHQEKVDYVYLLWEDLVFQIENKENKVDWYMANDDPILTTMRFIPQYEVVQRYGAILPDYLTNPAMKESEAYKTYHDLDIGKVQPKPKYVRRSSRTKTDEAPKPSSGKRVKATYKVAKFGKKKKPALGLETLLDITLTKAEQMKMAIKMSKTQLHISQPSGSGVHEGTGVTPGVLDVPTYESNDEKISWKSSDEEDDDDEANFSTHNEEEEEEESFDPRVQTPSHVESTDDEDDNEEVQGVNIEGEAMDEEAINEEDKGNELYRNLNVNLEGRDVEMTNDQPSNVQTTRVTEDTHVIITPVIPEGQQQSFSVSSGFVSNMLNPRPDTSIDSIFNLNTEATSLVNVPVTTIAEPPLVFATTLPPPPTHLITHMQQTPIPTPKTFNKTNQFADAVSSIPGIVDAYLANKMHEAVKTAVQLQSDKIKDEALAKNEAFLNSLDDNIKKIIKDQVKQQVKAQVSKILPKIKKIALVEAYESDKLILDTYGDTVSFKRRRDDEDKDEEPSAGSNRRSKRRRDGKEPESTKEPIHNDKDLEEPAHQEFDIGATEEQFDEEISQHLDWFQKPAKIPTLDRDWNKTLPAVHGPVQPWLSNLAREEGPRKSFDELMDTPLDFSAFAYNGGAVISVRKKGASKGVKSFEALDTMKLRANRIWNEGCLSGRMIRNRAGVIGLLYAGIESEIVAVRDLDNAFNSVAAGLGTGPCLRWRVVCGPKDCERDAGIKPTEVDEHEASDESRKHAQEARSNSGRLNQREMQIEHTNSTNGINTVSTPVSTAGPSFDNAFPSTPVNAAGPFVSIANESEE
ncbi:hypothetical protein Tco_0407161 [Tanacetum coccineum]